MSEVNSLTTVHFTGHVQFMFQTMADYAIPILKVIVTVTTCMHVQVAGPLYQARNQDFWATRAVPTTMWAHINYPNFAKKNEIIIFDQVAFI